MVEQKNSLEKDVEDLFELLKRTFLTNYILSKFP